ncbi:MAG: hypothetical protein ACOC2C_02525 [Cyclonatronaceae bacterium]
MPAFFRFSLLLCCALLWTGGEAAAQSGGFAGAYTRMGFGPRGMGMGNAMTAVYQQGVYAHYNPALAARVTETEVNFSASSMSLDRSLNMASVAFVLPPTAGLNIGLLHAGVQDFDGRNSSGVPTETFSTNELSGFIAFGLNPSERLSLGVTAKLLYANYFDELDNPLGFGLDAGFLYRFNEHLSLGGAAQDLFSGYTWNTSQIYGGSLSGSTDDFPTRFKLGLAYEFPIYGLLLSTEYETRSQSSELINREVSTIGGQPDIIERSETLTTGSSQFRIGSAWEAHERITLRAGWQVGDLDFVSATQQPFAGFSLSLPLQKINSYIDYAFTREAEGISYMHVFALRLDL